MRKRSIIKRKILRRLRHDWRSNLAWFGFEWYRLPDLAEDIIKDSPVVVAVGVKNLSLYWFSPKAFPLEGAYRLAKNKMEYWT